MQEEVSNINPEQLLTQSKKTLAQKADHYVANIGDAISPLLAYAQAHKMQNFFAMVVDKLHAKALVEAQKYGKKHTQYDTEFEVKEMGVKWVYDNCNDPELTDLLKQKAELDKKIKQREKFLQSMGESIEVLGKDGELTKIYPAVKKSTTKVALTY